MENRLILKENFQNGGFDSLLLDVYSDESMLSYLRERFARKRLLSTVPREELRLAEIILITSTVRCLQLPSTATQSQLFQNLQR